MHKRDLSDCSDRIFEKSTSYINYASYLQIRPMLICRPTSTFILKFNKPIANFLTNTTEISEETDKCRDVDSVSRRVLERLSFVSVEH